MMTKINQYHELFHLIQTSGVFEDSKTFVDCRARCEPAELLARYNASSTQGGFSLRAFVEANYVLPEPPGVFQSDVLGGIDSHLSRLWSVLTLPANATPADSAPGYDSLIALPKPYIVPGGRFREIYYWDSYFTLLGLRAAGHWSLVRNMVENFAYLLGHLGYIPNGNRRYYLGRSQPPFFALMVDLLAEYDGDETYAKYLPNLKAEYSFWQKGAEIYL
jgi:alpha,alpha-trehalase